jgi:23S rRNA pseudouridine1911/1915/1917 synthase
MKRRPEPYPDRNGDSKHTRAQEPPADTGLERGRARESAFDWLVPDSHEGTRLDKFLMETGRFVSRHRVQRLIEAGRVRVDGAQAKASLRLRPLQRIHVEVPSPEPMHTPAEPIPLDVLYEDEDLLVVNKPAGMVVHPAAGHTRDTLVNALLYRCRDLSGIGGALRPGIVHRLDKQTSGLLVVAKGDAAHLALSKQFKAHSILREYVGLVHGRPSGEAGCVDAPIGRHFSERKKMSTRTRRGRRAVTHWRIERRFRNFTLLRFTLQTGRTHQIRVHMAEEGHPIVGDGTYGGKRTRLSHLPADHPDRLALKGMDRFFLHAERLGFEHPVRPVSLRFSCPIPTELEGILGALTPEEGL